MRRRDLILAGLAVTAAAAAEGLRPRHKRILLKANTKVENLVPKTFSGWTAEGSSGLVSPDQAGKLAKSLYSEIVERIYHNDDLGAAVMVLAAYGDTQSDLLQLHRPESCYPAVGYRIESTVPKQLALAGGALLPVRHVVATAESRTENIVYWTRIGESLPLSAREQRQDRLTDALRGYVSDGILFRCSAIGQSQACFDILDKFVPALLTATPPVGRPALVGTEIARKITA